MNPQAIIVMRHADDLPSNWPLSSEVDILPNGVTVKVPQHGLTQAGFDRAALLGNILQPWISNTFADVTRVITKDPQLLSETPNPFDTIWPFINNTKVMDVQLLSGLSDIQALLNSNNVMPSEGSVFICWDVEGMWSPKDSHGNRSSSPLPGSILDTLSSIKLDGNNFPQKATTLYTFTNPTVMDKYDLRIYNVVGSIIQ